MPRCTIVGVGALGSHLVHLLRNEPLELVVVDDDRVGAKNVLSQFHPKSTVGKNKTVALAQTMQFLYGAKLRGIPHRVEGDNCFALLAEGMVDLVIDTLDNAPSRRLVQTVVRAHKIPCLHGALAADGAYGRSCWDEQFVIDEGAAGAPTCEDGRHLPFVALVAAYLARSVQEFVATGRKVGFEVSPFGAVAT